MNTFPSLCGSVAGNPSTLGVKLHNAAYRQLGLDITYLAFGATDVADAIAAMRLLKMRGLAVSMPFKESVIPLLDRVTDDVRLIGACNTVVHEPDGALVGHNTDYLGALGAIDELGGPAITDAVVFGAGGAARAVAYALKSRGSNVVVLARRREAAARLMQDLRLDGSDTIDHASSYRAQLVVNATPDAEYPDGPIDLDVLLGAQALLDVVFLPRETALAAAARQRGLAVAAGWRMLLHQAAHQFRLYTYQDPPLEAMGLALSEGLDAV